MKTKILLHIGAPKTGSSAVQSFLQANHQYLAACGVIVPPSRLSEESGVEGHQVWFFQELVSDLDAGAEQVSSYLKKLEKDRKGDLKQIVFSAENLSNLVKWGKLFEGLDEKYEVSILLYVRRQDEYLLSAWQQWHSKVRKDFWAWLLKESGTMANWRRTIENWEVFVPSENINVRVYERERLKDCDVVKDFCQFVEADTSVCEFQEKVVNPSYTQAVLDLVESSDILAKHAHDNDFFNLVCELTGSNYFKDRKESAITFEQRMAILSKYEQSNNWVFEKYVKHKNHYGKLFKPPSKDDYIVLSREEIESRQISLLADLVYGLNKKIEKVKKWDNK